MKLEKLNSKMFKAVSNEELVKMEGGGPRWSWRRIKHGADPDIIIGIEGATVSIIPEPSDAVLDAALTKALDADFARKVATYQPLFTTTTLTK